MNKYHKINTIFKRTKCGELIVGEYSQPEFEYLKDNIWVLTEKVDGTNIRVFWDGDRVWFGGKSDNAQMPIFLLYKLRTLFDSEKTKETFKLIFPKENEPLEVCLYGEGYGAKIQKGGGNYNPNGVDFVLFDVKIGDWWLKREDVEDIAQKLNIKIVPILGETVLSEAIAMATKGFNSQWGDFLAEGIVLKPKVELFTRNGHRVITKIKHKDFKNSNK